MESIKEIRNESQFRSRSVVLDRICTMRDDLDVSLDITEFRDNPIQRGGIRTDCLVMNLQDSSEDGADKRNFDVREFQVERHPDLPGSLSGRSKHIDFRHLSHTSQAFFIDPFLVCFLVVRFRSRSRSNPFVICFVVPCSATYTSSIDDSLGIATELSICVLAFAVTTFSRFHDQPRRTTSPVVVPHRDIIDGSQS